MPIQCKHCQLGNSLDEQGPQGETIIECRCNPPQPLLMPMGVGMDNQPKIAVNFFFPRMHPESWCGQGIAKISEIN